MLKKTTLFDFLFNIKGETRSEGPLSYNTLTINKSNKREKKVISITHTHKLLHAIAPLLSLTFLHSCSVLLAPLLLFQCSDLDCTGKKYLITIITRHSRAHDAHFILS